ELPARLRSAATYHADLLRDGELAHHHRDRVGILIVQNAGCAVSQRTGEAVAVGSGAVAVEPLDGASDVGERSANLTVRVQLGLVIDDQTLVLADRGGRREHG